VRWRGGRYYIEGGECAICRGSAVVGHGVISGSFGPLIRGALSCQNLDKDLLFLEILR
jgi:hypothetical protein